MVIYRMSVNGHVTERYYHMLDNAKRQMLDDAESVGIEFNTITKVRISGLSEHDAKKGLKVYKSATNGDSVVFEIIIKGFSDERMQMEQGRLEDADRQWMEGV